ncbi:MAG: alpha/beta hydrolase [Curtobacterium sp.]
MSVSTTDGAIEGRHGPVAIRTYRSDHEVVGTTPLVWLHGGAFSYGGLDQLESDAPAERMADAGRTVVTVDYHRVGPWNPFRDPKEETLTGVRFPVPFQDVVAEVARETPRRAVLLGGASAGACLAAAAAMDRVRAGDPIVSGLVLAYGTFHAALPPVRDDVRQRIRGLHGIKQFRPSTVHRMNLNYAGSRAAMGDPRAFPGGHDPAGLPPTLLLDADRDSLRASGTAFAYELRRAGVDVEHTVVPGSRHGFLDRPGKPDFDAGTALVLAWLQQIDGGRP